MSRYQENLTIERYVQRAVKTPCPNCGRRPTYRMLADKLGICVTTIHRIVTGQPAVRFPK